LRDFYYGTLVSV